MKEVHSLSWLPDQAEVPLSQGCPQYRWIGGQDSKGGPQCVGDLWVNPSEGHLEGQQPFQDLLLLGNSQVVQGDNKIIPE